MIMIKENDADNEGENDKNRGYLKQHVSISRLK